MFEKFNALVNEPMSEHTTLKLGGPADYLVFPRSAEEIGALFAEAGAYNLPVTVIGHGSNLLVLDGGIRGLVICIGKNMRKITRDGNRITAQAGTMLGSAAIEAADAGLTGLEFASGIPGTAGGAVFMNAGAYGGEMKDCVVKVYAVTDGKEVVFTNEEMKFGYRESIAMQKNMIITGVDIRLQKGDKDSITAMMNDLNGRRREKQPLEYPSAGSTFKRPEGYFAGKLIMDSGLAGYSVGDAEVSEKHCGFVINKGHATSDEIYKLICNVQDIVKEKTGIMLETEVRLIGEF